MWAIIKKELKAYFTTPIGYIFIGVFLIAFSVSFYFTVIGYGNVNFEYIYYSLPTILVLASITNNEVFFRGKKNWNRTIANNITFKSYKNSFR